MGTGIISDTPHLDRKQPQANREAPGRCGHPHVFTMGVPEMWVSVETPRWERDHPRFCFLTGARKCPWGRYQRPVLVTCSPRGGMKSKLPLRNNSNCPFSLSLSQFSMACRNLLTLTSESPKGSLSGVWPQWLTGCCPHTPLVLVYIWALLLCVCVCMHAQPCLIL